MSSSTSAKRFAASLLVLACPLIAVFFVLKPKKAAPEPPPEPLMAATRVASAPQWSEAPLAGNIPYQWYTQNAFLYRRLDRSLAVSDSDQKTNPTAAIAHSYHAVGGDLEEAGPNGPANWILSPDRRWLLTFLGAPGHRRWAAIALDGTRYVTFPAHFNFHPIVCWKGDSSGWIEIFQSGPSGAAALYSLSPKNAQATITPLVNRRENYYGRPEVLGGIGSDGVVVATWAEDDRHRVPLRIFHVAHTTEPTHLLAPLPAQANLMEAEMSPDGQRMAWVFIMPDHRKHGLQLPFFKPREPAFRQELWISRLDGGGMRHITAGDAQSKEIFSGVHFVRWLPDGNTLSFVNDDIIYTIPAS